MDEEQLVARLSIVDDMSDTLSHISDAGTNMFSTFESASSAASAAFDNVSSTTASTASSIDSLNSAMSSYESSASSAASSTDYWTSAVGNYDKSALEAVHTTEELVEMGMKSADALLEESTVTESLDGAMNALVGEMSSAASSQNELSQAIENANAVLEDGVNAENMSAEAKAELERASIGAADALKDLETAQNEARTAMDNFDSIMNAEVLDVNALSAAAEQAANSTETLKSAQENAQKAVSELSQATEEAAKSAEDFGNRSEESGEKSTDALSAIAETAVAVAIADKIKDITASVYEMTEAFSEAEKTVVNATGATGETLEGLENSMMSAFGEHHADLDSAAGAIGEINTRMALTGDALTDVTGKFLDFSSIAGSDVVGSVQNVTKVMNKWNVEQSEVVSVLNKLAYAGQISGASVDSLSSQSDRCSCSRLRSCDDSAYSVHCSGKYGYSCRN